MAVKDQIDRISAAKSAIKTAIEAKGVTVTDGTPIDDYAAKIGEIETGGGLYTVTDIGDIATGFNATGKAGERMVWKNNERYASDPIVKDENGDKIPLLTNVNLGTFSRFSCVFIMPLSNVTVDLSSSGGTVGGGGGVVIG